MKLASVRLIVKDMAKVVEFYELITECRAQWLAPVFAEIVMPGAAIAIGSEETVPLFRAGCAKAASNETAIIEFYVTDVDYHFNRLRMQGIEFVHEPRVMPWGNRTLQLRDPEGTLVSLFTPVTDNAIERFNR